MKHFISILFLCAIFTRSNAQSYHLQARVNGFEGTRAYLLQFKNDQQAIIDSTSSLDGVFEFKFPEKTKAGVYRVLLGEKSGPGPFKDIQFFDVIFNFENIVLNTSLENPVADMNISQSGENDIFYRFLRFNEIYQSKLSRITELLVLYDREDDFYGSLSREFVSLQTNSTQYLITLANELPGSLASSIIKLSTIPVVEKTDSPEEMKLFLRSHYFDLISFSDERLLNTSYISKTILDYLGLFRDPVLNQPQQENIYKSAIDTIMEAVSGNPVIYDYVLNLLVNGFQKLQMEKVLVHIAENYITGGCETDSKKLLQKRLEGYEKMSVGKQAPDIFMFDQNGKQVSLYSLDNDYILVVFWASWCPHCTVFLKELGKWYPGKDIDLEVFAVSIDSSRFSWEERIMMDNYPWINTYSGAGWDGKAPKEYNVYATPTLFLLDREHRIVGKPLTFKEFQNSLPRAV